MKVNVYGDTQDVQNLAYHRVPVAGDYIWVGQHLRKVSSATLYDREFAGAVAEIHVK